jgi:hypothetical protein
VATVDPQTGHLVALAPGLAQVQAWKNNIIVDAHAVLVKSDAQFAFDQAKRAKTVRVATSVGLLSGDQTPPVVAPPLLATQGQTLTIDWPNVLEGESAITELTLDIRSLDGTVTIALGQTVFEGARPYQITLPDARPYRVTLYARNTNNLIASTSADVTPGVNPLAVTDFDASDAANAVVSWTSAQAGLITYTVTILDQFGNPVASYPVTQGGTSHTTTLDLSGLPMGSYTAVVSDTGNASSSPASPLEPLNGANTLYGADGGDNGDGTVTLTWSNTAADPNRSYTITIKDASGTVVATVPYTGSGTQQAATVDLEALGLPAGGYSFVVTDDVTNDTVAGATFIFGGTTAGGEPGTLSPDAATPAGAFASASTPGATPAKAFDGSEATYWETSQTGAAIAGTYLGQHLAPSAEVGRLVFIQDYTNGYYAAAGKVQYSADGVGWVDATAETAFTTNVVEFAEILPVGVQPYWRVLFTQGNPDGKPLRVSELNMYPYAVPSEGFGQTPYGTGPYGY